MRIRDLLVMLAPVLLAAGLSAQAVSPSEITDAQSRQLQDTYLKQLESVAQRASQLKFPYHFYFSHTLDISEKQQRSDPSASIQFEQFQGKQVLAITGNYYASYSTTLMTPNQRARQTFQDVMLPILKIVVPAFDQNAPFSAFALEVSHHVRGKVLGVQAEGVENLLVIMPRSAAEQMVSSQSADSEQSALLASTIFLDAEPTPIWLKGDQAPKDVQDSYLKRVGPSRADASLESSEATPAASAPAEPELDPVFYEDHDTSSAHLGDLQNEYQSAINSMVAQLATQANFPKYAPPTFIELHGCAMLQISTDTKLDLKAPASRYQLAALAFDKSIANLVRPVLKSIQDPDFQGVDFSTTVTAGDQVEAVEFAIPFSKLRCLSQYDCTAQQALNSSLVLINGERVSLHLERDETGAF